MGRKRTAADRRRYADQNGFNDDETTVDDDPVRRDLLPYTKERYMVQIDLWNE
jgi:hypothetical protein